MLQHTKCRGIGTSKGVIIPNNLLKTANIEINDVLDIQYSEEQDVIIIKKPVKEIRAGWAEAFKKLHAAGDDELLIPDVFEDEEFNETI